VKPAIQRLLDRVEINGAGCWIWTGATSNGYGKIGRGRSGEGEEYTHRLAYMELVGTIPEGLTVDHLCRVRSCCNPEHLEVVTNAENIARVTRSMTMCKHGHPFEGRNVYTSPDGKRHCRTCRNESRVRFRARHGY